ncbi:MAG: SDR family NAD(P)-dependent oxidoreductase [Burkholderiales bacterium]
MEKRSMPAAKKSKRQTALITGASSGIGEALAACFAKGGFDLVLVARSEGKLKVLAAALSSEHKIKVRVEPADLSKPDAAGNLAAAMKRAKVAIDVLVNNAGVLEQGGFVSMPAARHQELIGLNVAGLTAMLAHFAPPMVKRGHGRILNVASIAAFQAVPTLATYAATKAYVLSLTESLSEELKGTGVSITALCPGLTATNMVSAIQEANARFAKLPGILIGNVDDVAAQGFQACMKGEVIRVPGLLNRAATLGSRATPKWLMRRIVGAFGRGIS